MGCNLLNQANDKSHRSVYGCRFMCILNVWESKETLDLMNALIEAWL